MIAKSNAPHGTARRRVIPIIVLTANRMLYEPGIEGGTMNVKKPNRTRIADADRNEMQQKQSGDQHILPLDDMDEDPHRPHRLSRENRSVQAGSAGESHQRHAGGGNSGSRRH